MRAQWEDLSFGTTQKAYARIHEIGMGAVAAASRRDIWVRFHVSATTGKWEIYAYATKSEAHTAVPPATYLARCLTGSIGSGNPASFTMTDNAVTNPDMTGLVIQATLAANPDGDPHDSVWAYTVIPHIECANNIRAILLEYVGAGQVLEDFDVELGTTGHASDHILVAHPVAANVFPAIMIHPRTGAIDESLWMGGTFNRKDPIDIYILSAGIDDPSTEYQQNEAYLAAVLSIVCDERRTSKGEVLTLTLVSIEDASVEDYAGLRWTSKISIEAEFDSCFRDDLFPRP